MLQNGESGPSWPKNRVRRKVLNTDSNLSYPQGVGCQAANSSLFRKTFLLKWVKNAVDSIWDFFGQPAKRIAWTIPSLFYANIASSSIACRFTFLLHKTEDREIVGMVVELPSLAATAQLSPQCAPMECKTNRLFSLACKQLQYPPIRGVFSARRRERR